MIGIFLALVAAQAPAMPANADRGGLAFECALGDYGATVAGKPSEKHTLSLLSTFGEKGVGEIQQVRDPSNLLNGTKLSTLALRGGAKKEDAYQFVIRSSPDAPRPIVLMVAPNGESVSATARRDFIGVLGFTDQKQPAYIGKCSIVAGESARQLFGLRKPERGQ